MNYIYNISDNDFSCVGFQFLKNNIINIDDTSFELLNNNNDFKNHIKNKNLIIDSLENLQTLRLANQEIQQFIDMNTNIDSYQKAILEKKNLEAFKEKISDMKKNPIIKNNIDLNEVLNILNTKEKEIEDTILSKEADFIIEARILKEKEIDLDRDKDIEGGIEFKGHIFQSAKKDRDLLTSTIALFNIQGGVPEGFTWIAKDNTNVPMTLNELVQLGILMANSVSLYTYKARELKDSLQHKKTIADVEAVKYE